MFIGFDKEKYERLIDMFKLPVKTKAKKLSRGQQAMLEISLGVSKYSDYLLLDEPFLGADIFSRQSFLKLLIEEKREEQTIIITSHQVQEIQNFLDYAYIVKEGTIVAKVNTTEDGCDLINAMKIAYLGDNSAQ